jgi:hypothetical protein
MLLSVHAGECAASAGLSGMCCPGAVDELVGRGCVGLANFRLNYLTSGMGCVLRDYLMLIKKLINRTPTDPKAHLGGLPSHLWEFMDAAAPPLPQAGSQGKLN